MGVLLMAADNTLRRRERERDVVDGVEVGGVLRNSWLI